MRRWNPSLVLRVLLPLALPLWGCATAADVDVVVGDAGRDAVNRPDTTTTGDDGTPDGSTPDSSAADTGKADTGATPDSTTTDTGAGGDTATSDSATPDTATPDTGTPDTGTPDTGTPDTGTPDTGTPDTGPLDTGVTDTAPDTGVTFTALIYTDTTSLSLGDGTLADEAVLALGGTPTLADDLDFNSKFDAKVYDVIIVDSAYDYLPTGMDTRLSTFVGGGGRIVFAYWDLNSSATLRTALQIATTTSFTTILPVYRDTTATFDPFAGPKQTVPSPLVGTDSVSDDGDRLTVTAAGAFLAARFSSAAGTGAIAVTRSGRAIVNGFAPYEFQSLDNDGDGKKDVQELYENEIAYVRSK